MAPVGRLDVGWRIRNGGYLKAIQRIVFERDRSNSMHQKALFLIAAMALIATPQFALASGGGAITGGGAVVGGLVGGPMGAIFCSMLGIAAQMMQTCAARAAKPESRHSGIGAAAAITGNYSRAPKQKAPGEQGLNRGARLARLALGARLSAPDS
jgi:hypothetical protein